MNVNRVQHRMQLPVGENIRVSETGAQNERVDFQNISVLAQNNAFYRVTFLFCNTS